jgi:trimethylamine--corrinoid protein Co-methyltransferase
MIILEKTGMRFHHDDILNLLKARGIRVSGKIAHFTEDQVMAWTGKAPEKFAVFARNPAYNFTVGKTSVEFGPGYGAPNIIDAGGQVRRAVLSDYISFLKLVHQSDHFKVNGGILVEPSDLDHTCNYAIMLYHILTHSDKFIIGMEGPADQMRMTMDMLKIVFGGHDRFIEKPRVMTIVNTLSPLQMDRHALDTLIIYASHGQPVMITPAALAGFTGPVTLAGLIAMANAETLAGIAVAQMLSPGTPVIYGIQTSTGDMRTGGYVVGNPEHALCLSYGARLAKAYGLPCRGGGAPSDAKQVSVQSGYESMLILSTCVREKINIIMHSAGIIDSFNAMSFDKFMIDLEIIDMVSRIQQDIRIDDETLALNIIHDTGCGGQFMTSAHTARLCRKEIWCPAIGIKGIGVKNGSNKAILENAQKKKQQMLAAYKKINTDIGLKVALKDYLSSKGVKLELQNSVTDE